MSKTRRWLVLATVSAGLLMVSVDTTVLYTALPTLTGDLQADASQKLWIINAYPLVMAGLLLGAGTLGDRIGHKRMYLTGLALFAAASLLAAFAPSPPVLIAARAFLAVGAAAMLPATAALIRVTFDDEHERGIAIGVWGTMAVLGAALGPIVGGLLLQHFWWGSVFLLNIPVVLLALAATVAFVPGGSGHRDRPWDLIASLQAMIALAGLVYAIQEAAKPGPVPLAIVLALLTAAAGSVTFVRRQRRQTYPLIDFSLFRNRSLLTGVIAAALAMAATAGAELLLTQRLQLVLGLTPLHAGLIVTAFAAGSLPVGVLAGGLLHRTGARPLIGGGLLLGALGVLVTLLLTPGAVPLLGGGRSPAWVVPGLVLAGAGLGIVMVAASAAIISGAPPQRAGMASSIESVSYELGSLAGVTVLGTILTAVYTGTIHLPATAPAQAAGSIDQARAAAGHLPAGQAHTLLDAAASAFDSGYTLTLAITAIALGRRLSLAGIVVTVGSVAALAAIMAHSGTAASAAELAPAMTLIGLGTGATFSTIYDIAIGDIDPAEAGSASGSLSSVQQLANAIGAAVITTIYFGALAGGPAHAMTLSLLTVITIGVLSCLAIPLLPRHAQPARTDQLALPPGCNARA